MVVLLRPFLDLCRNNEETNKHQHSHNNSKLNSKHIPIPITMSGYNPYVESDPYGGLVQGDNRPLEYVIL